MRGIFAALCAFGMTLPAAAATPAYFSACDGYGAPNKNGDGMLKPANALFGLFIPSPGYGDTRQRPSALGEAGIAACDQALADPRLLPIYWMRRVSLLRARAIHDLNRGRTDDALADLKHAMDAAQAPADPYYRRSLGLGIELVRAAVLEKAGKTEEAAQLASEVGAERPYDAEIARAALAINYRASGDRKALAENLRKLAKLDPTSLPGLIEQEMALDQFDEAIRLRRMVVLQVVKPDGGWQTDTAAIDAQNVVKGAHLDGQIAYALAATHRADAARKALVAARAAVDAGCPPVDPSPGRARLSRQQRELEIRRGDTKDSATRVLDEWTKYVELRILVDTDPNSERLHDFVAATRIASATTTDIMRAIAHSTAPDQAIAALNLPAMQAVLDKEHEKIVFSPELLVRLLPETETAARVGRYAAGSKSFWSLNTNGFYVKPASIAGATTVEYDDVQSSAAMVEEMALLRAADLARQAGKKGMILLDRRRYERTLTVSTMYGAIQNSRPTGYTAEYDVLFVDPAKLPADHADEAWRVIDTDAVYASLASIYTAPPVAKTAAH